MKTLYYLPFLLLFFACGDSKRGEEPKLPDTKIVADTVEVEEELPAPEEPQGEQAAVEGNTLKLPRMGSFRLTTKEKTNQYGAGDCWGGVAEYLTENTRLAIDSGSCGDYGYTYTFYELDQRNNVQRVFVKEYQSAMTVSLGDYPVLREQFIDLTGEYVKSEVRTDTMRTRREEHWLTTTFRSDTLTNKEATAKRLQEDYQGLWTRKVEADY